MASDVTLEDLKDMNVNYYVTVISITIAIHEYLLTFSSELERFWRGGQLNWASGLFYLNRYLVLFGHIPIVMEFFWSTSNPDKIKICHQLQSYHQYLAIAIQVIVASMLVMRMYALYERSRRVLLLYLVVCTMVVAIGLWAVLGGKSQQSREVLFPIGCGVSLTHDQAIRLGAGWAGMLGFDTLVFGMTLYKSLTFVRAPGVNLLSVLLRDGSVYFAVMMASNLGNILTFVLGGPFTRGGATTFTNVISSITISRLMLNLRDPALVRHISKSVVRGPRRIRGSGSDRDGGVDSDTTYMTFLSDPVLYSTHVQPLNDLDWAEDEGGNGRGYYYNYLATGSSNRAKNDPRDIEMSTFPRPKAGINLSSTPTMLQ